MQKLIYYLHIHKYIILHVLDDVVVFDSTLMHCSIIPWFNVSFAPTVLLGGNPLTIQLLNLHHAGHLNGKTDALSCVANIPFDETTLESSTMTIFHTTGPARALVLNDPICLDASTFASTFQTSFLADICKATADSILLASFHDGKLKPGYVLDSNLLFFDGALVIPSKYLQSQILATHHDPPPHWWSLCNRQNLQTHLP
jgi:hypothetical protein